MWFTVQKYSVVHVLYLYLLILTKTPTINQLLNTKKVRKEKRKKNKTRALLQNPQCKGVCVKIFTRSPKNQIQLLEKFLK
jgi:ribosomal protein S12